MESYKFSRLLRLSTFQIGSAMGDIVVTSIWNRIMISTYHVPATLVGLLIAIRYLLAPLAMWAGYRSDRTLFLGLRRSLFIWGGRALMVLSLPLLVLSVGRFAASTDEALGWILAFASAILYGTGTMISGGPYLALVRESVPAEKRGFALSVAETSLIIWFAISGIIFSLVMPVYTPHAFAVLVAVTTFVAAFFWSYATMGVEQPDWEAIGARLDRREGERAAKRRQAGDGPAAATEDVPPGQTEEAMGSGDADVVASASAELSASAPDASEAESLQGAGFLATFRTVAGDRRTRLFFLFLSTATLFAWIQDAILEPFGADAFGLTYGRTTRFNSYWQGATVVALLAAGALLRKRRPEMQRPVAQWGLAGMAAGTVLLAVAALGGVSRLIEVALVLFGLGFGIYTFGGLSLMAVMSPSVRAGAYLGLWSIAVLLAKGAGTLLGGILRDAFLDLAGMTPGAAYGLLFAVEAAGLFAAALIVRRIDFSGFSRDYEPATGPDAASHLPDA